MKHIIAVGLFFALICPVFSSDDDADADSNYVTTKATKITTNPDHYKGKKVLVYVKFDEKNGDTRFTDLAVPELEYVYDPADKNIASIIDNAKPRDLLTIKGTVHVENFTPTIHVDGLVKDWIDTTLLPYKTKKPIITCPNCGYSFNPDNPDNLTD